MTIAQLKNIILEAFINVQLGKGTSLKQAEVYYNYGSGTTEAELHALPQIEITDKWQAIPLEHLEKYTHISSLDAEGFRYYIPAFMISMLNEYDTCSMRVFDTLGGLYPKNDYRRDYQMKQYSLLDTKQKETIAIYLSELPNLLQLELSDSKIVHRALRNHWGQFLKKPDMNCL